MPAPSQANTPVLADPREAVAALRPGRPVPLEAPLHGQGRPRHYTDAGRQGRGYERRRRARRDGVRRPDSPSSGSAQSPQGDNMRAAPRPFATAQAVQSARDRAPHARKFARAVELLVHPGQAREPAEPAGSAAAQSIVYSRQAMCLLSRLVAAVQAEPAGRRPAFPPRHRGWGRSAGRASSRA